MALACVDLCARTAIETRLEIDNWNDRDLRCTLCADRFDHLLIYDVGDRRIRTVICHGNRNPARISRVSVNFRRSSQPLPVLREASWFGSWAGGPSWVDERRISGRALFHP